MILEFLGLGVLGITAAVVVLWVVITCLLETEHEVVAFLFAACLIYFLKLVHVVDLIGYVWINPGYSALWVFGYFVIGALSLYPKWYGFVSDYLEEWEEQREHSPIPAAPPSPHSHKERIISWAIFWPWSMVWFLVRHPLRRIGREIYNLVEGSLVRMSEAMTEKFNKRFVQETKR